LTSNSGPLKLFVKPKLFYQLNFESNISTLNYKFSVEYYELAFDIKNAENKLVISILKNSLLNFKHQLK